MKQIEHANILPFYGVSTAISHSFLVFPWYKNGNVDQYLERNPLTNRYDLVSTLRLTVDPQRSYEIRKQLCGALSGLHFLHSNGVVHGALRPVRQTLL